MKIKFQNTPEQVELVKAMASRDRNVAYEAQATLANLMGPVLGEVLDVAGIMSPMFDPIRFGADENPSIPTDLYYDVTSEDYIQVWSQQGPGGLPRNEPVPTMEEMKIHTYTLDSAIAFDRKYAARSGLDVVARSFARLAQEVLLKQEKIASNIMIGAMANGVTWNNDHVQFAGTQGRFLLQDLNELITLAKRMNRAWQGGTPETGSVRGVTDLMVSPRIAEELRAMSFNPINTKDSPTGAQAAIAPTEGMRDEIYRAAGVPNFYGISIVDIVELDKGEVYNQVFNTLQKAGGYSTADGTTKVDQPFDPATQEVLIGIDRTRSSLYKAIAVDEDTSATFVLEPTDEFVRRQRKIGWYGGLEEGRFCLDDRAFVGKIFWE